MQIIAKLNDDFDDGETLKKIFKMFYQIGELVEEYYNGEIIQEPCDCLKNGKIAIYTSIKFKSFNDKALFCKNLSEML